LTPAFEVDFYKLKLGRAHHMKFSAKAAATAALGANAVQVAAALR
jgi:methanethiol oxidase